MTDPKIEAAVKRLCKRARWSTAGSHAAAIEAELLAARADGAREAFEAAVFVIERTSGIVEAAHKLKVMRGKYAARAAEREEKP